MLDREAIFELIRLERFWRDQGQWDRVASAFTDDAIVRTTWFEGTAAEFAEASRVMAVNGRHSKHPIWPITARIVGDRALAESRAEIQNRSDIDGVEVDMIQYCRFCSRAERTPDGWRLASFEAIYQKDTIAPVNPADVVPIDWAEVSAYRPAYRIWAWAMQRRGYTVSQELLGDDRPDLVQAFYAAEEHWLQTGAEA
jgi:hypothetical protein